MEAFEKPHLLGVYRRPKPSSIFLGWRLSCAAFSEVEHFGFAIQDGLDQFFWSDGYQLRLV